MAITVSLAITSVGPSFADTPLNGMVTIVNNGSNTVQIQSIQLFEVPPVNPPLAGPGSNMGLVFRQPDFLVPNVAPGTYPTIANAATANYPFAVLSPGPPFPGDPPQAPGGRVFNPAEPPSNTTAVIGCFVQAYDATAVAFVNNSATLLVAPMVASSMSYPPAAGGAEAFNLGSNAVNWFYF